MFRSEFSGGQIIDSSQESCKSWQFFQFCFQRLIHVCVHIHTHTRVCVYTHMHTHMCIHMCLCTCMCVYIYAVMLTVPMPSKPEKEFLCSQVSSAWPSSEVRKGSRLMTAWSIWQVLKAGQLQNCQNTAFIMNWYFREMQSLAEKVM